MILLPIGKLYGRVMDVRNALYDRNILKSHGLGARTISVGNITTGGTGKTPLVSLISEILIDAGETVCILTRGYGRANPNDRVLVSDGRAILAGAAEGGDEPAELAARLGGRAIIISDADRLSAGRWAKQKFGVTVFLLDDGFQHRRVRRDLDIVCIDATDPCGGGRALPAGRLRESFAGLKRADAIVLTRSDLVDDVSAIEERLRKQNQSVPVFRASTRVAGLVPLEQFHAKAQRTQRRGPEDDQVGKLVSGNHGAFCAIGNPDAFFRTVEQYFGDRSRLVLKIALRDHHPYNRSDVDNIELRAKHAGAGILITTAKDAVKLDADDFSLPLFVAIAETEIDDREEFGRFVNCSG